MRINPINKITHLVTVPRPRILGTDALWNEALLLAKEFPGSCQSIFPISKPTSLIPKSWIGLTQIFKRKGDKIIHIHSQFLYYFPFFKFTKAKIIYTVATSIKIQHLKNIEKLKTLDKIIVCSTDDKDKLDTLGLGNVICIAPGLNLSHIKPQPKRKNRTPFKILTASAPWERSQIEKKGYPLIFQFLKKNEDFHFTILLRGTFEEELKQLAKEYQVSSRCTFINKKVDVNSYFKEIDATLLITNQQEIIKAYPHSLIESLAANKPIITTENIAIGRFTKNHTCGVTLKNFNLLELETRITELSQNYDNYFSNTLGLTSHFDIDNWINAYANEYVELEKLM